MFENPSLMKRIAIGKLVGLIVGIISFFLLPLLAEGVDPMLKWGVLLWYTTLGAVIGVYGVFTRHPILDLPMPWWVRAPIIGAWFNFVLVFFAYETFASLLLAIFGEGGVFLSPFWMVADGAFAGLIIGFFATRFGGEGKDLPLG